MTGRPAARDVVDRYLALVGGGRFGELADLYAEDAVVEHPYDPPGERFLRGRPALAAHFARLAAFGLRMRADDLVVHITADPETVISEFTYRGHAAGGAPVHRRCVFVTTVRDGLIVASRDYQAATDPDPTPADP